jgi:hypothetical protein
MKISRDNSYITTDLKFYELRYIANIMVSCTPSAQNTKNQEKIGSDFAENATANMKKKQGMASED